MLCPPTLFLPRPARTGSSAAPLLSLNPQAAAPPLLQISPMAAAAKLGRRNREMKARRKQVKERKKATGKLEEK
jgi:hypothetical protein